MDSRLKLHAELEEACGNKNVYFQPPATVSLRYPAILYRRKEIRSDHADNIPYKQGTAYEVTVMDFDPDSIIVKRVSTLPKCYHDRFYAADNLNHDVFVIYR